MNQSPAPSRGRGDSGRNPRNHRGPQGRGVGGPRGSSPQQQQPVKVHGGSGVPFGYVPAYLPGSASLVEELNQRVMIVLRDGKHLVGVSFYDGLCLSFNLQSLVLNPLPKNIDFLRRLDHTINSAT